MTNKELFWKAQYHMRRIQDPRSSSDPGNYVLQLENYATNYVEGVRDIILPLSPKGGMH
jgi:hypothetical protein